MEYEIYLMCNMLGLTAISLTFFYHYVAAKPAADFTEARSIEAEDM